MSDPSDSRSDFPSGTRLAATICLTLGLTAAGLVATAFALAAAALNAVFGICLGCEVYLRLPNRLRRAFAA